MKQLLLNLSFLFVCIGAFANDTSINTLWKKANDFYLQKQYDSAIVYCQSIQQQHPTNASVYYNLGNAYYRKNIVTEAVLNYERALFLNPQYKEAKENNLLAKSRIPNAIKPIKDIFFVRWWDTITASNWANTWAILSIILFLGLAFLIFYGISKNRLHHIAPQLFIILPIINLILLFLAYIAAYNKNNCKLAVVNSKNALINNGKSTSVPEATTVLITKQEGNGFLVTLPDNRTGWMRKSDLTFVHSTAKK